MRNKKGLLFSLTVLLLLLFGMPITASADAIEVPIKVTLRNEETKSFINYLNAQRKDLGLTQYTVDSTLMELARQRATDICIYFAHQTPLKATSMRVGQYLKELLPDFPSTEHPSTGVNESIAVGIGNASGVYTAWYSDEHRPCLVSSSYYYCGVAAVDYYNTRYWVLLVSSFPIGDTVSVSNIGSDTTWTDTVQVDTAKLPAASTVNSVDYGSSDDVQLKARNKGDGGQLFALGYIWDSYTASVFSAKANNPDIFTVTSDGKIVPHKVGSGTVTLYIKGYNIGDVSITVKPQQGVFQDGSTKREFKASFAKSSYDWTGSAICPKPSVVTDWYGNKLVENVDYKMEYSSNINPTTSAKANIVGIGNYEGSNWNGKISSFTFSITKKEGTSSESGSSSNGNTGSNSSSGGSTGNTGSNTGNTSSGGTNSGSTGSSGTNTGSGNTGSGSTTNQESTFVVKPAKKNYTYTGKAIKAKLTVYANGKKLSAKNYTVKYKNNKNTGIATILVTGKGSYAAWKGTGTFNILPKKPAFSKVQSKKTGTAVLKWKKLKQVNGYEVQFSTDKKFRTFDSAKTGKVSVTLKKLISKKTYYVRVRGYRNVKGGRIYGAWSKVKKVKIK